MEPILPKLKEGWQRRTIIRNKFNRLLENEDFRIDFKPDLGGKIREAHFPQATKLSGTELCRVLPFASFCSRRSNFKPGVTLYPASLAC